MIADFSSLVSSGESGDFMMSNDDGDIECTDCERSFHSDGCETGDGFYICPFCGEHVSVEC